MHDLRGAKRSLKRRIPWRALGIAASLVVIAAAFIVLYRILHDIELREVVAAFKSNEPYELVLAGVFVAIAYFTLTFYDYFALRTIGRGEVPYRTAALASFTSYSIGHNVGFSVISGGTVRYRVYSASGLSGIEVAKICFIAGLTFWLGNLAVLGLGATFDSMAASAIDRLPISYNRGIGIAILVALAGYIIWVSAAPRHIGRDNWTVMLPGGKLTFLQILIGIVDLACATAAMYVLMPDRPNIDFLSLMVIFVSATLLGFASNSPGGLGVFDAAMLLAMPQFAREDLVGALLLFRLYYYVVPFALAVAIIGVRELLIDLPWVSAKIHHDAPPGGPDESGKTRG
jgi:glycosyltransferase 2 family protein